MAVPSIPADPNDDHVLACALAGDAGSIVSGDGHLLLSNATSASPSAPRPRRWHSSPGSAADRSSTRPTRTYYLTKVFPNTCSLAFSVLKAIGDAYDQI